VSVPVHVPETVTEYPTLLVAMCKTMQASVVKQFAALVVMLPVELGAGLSWADRLPPIASITSEKNNDLIFMGLSFYVSVLESRPIEMSTAYHSQQVIAPYRSTIAMHAWLKSKGCFLAKTRILDMCCGQGGPTAYLATQEPQCDFMGMDLDEGLIDKAITQDNLHFRVGDIFAPPLDCYGKFDGVVSFQVLSWLSDVERPLREIGKLKPKWIAASSLFYDGPISVDRTVHDHESGKHHYYNIYSLPQTQKLLAGMGYETFHSAPFDIDIDLPRPTAGLGTYTEMTPSGRRLQISGPMLMPWYFILAK